MSRMPSAASTNAISFLAQARAAYPAAAPVVSRPGLVPGPVGFTAIAASEVLSLELQIDRAVRMTIRTNHVEIIDRVTLNLSVSCHFFTLF
jgi:hypothetical protein